MKLAIVTSVAVILSAGYALAGAGAPVPEGSQTPPPSGRPSAPLDDAACQDVWKMAAPNGDTLAKDKAVPFVVNFEMVDSDKDGKISKRNLRLAAAPDGSKSGCIDRERHEKQSHSARPKRAPVEPTDALPPWKLYSVLTKRLGC